MVKIVARFKNYLLNRSAQYRFYKSQYAILKEDNSSNQKKIVELKTLLKKDNSSDQKVFKGTEELKSEIYSPKGGFSKNKRGKKLADIRNNHPANSIKNVSIGEYTYGNPKIERFNQNDKLIIGKFCSISSEVTILIGKGHNTHSASTYPFSTFIGARRANIKRIPGKGMQYKDTVIGNDVWIGYGALILSGVTIGDGAVIGAGAVVSKDVEPYSIVVGSPLKHIRYRFPKEVRDMLVEKKWWDLPDEKIEELAPYLIDTNIHELLERL